MKKLLAALICYCILAVIFLPLLVTFFCGGFVRSLPKAAKACYYMDINDLKEEKAVGDDWK